MRRLVDLVGEVNPERVAVVVPVLGFVGIGKIVDLPQVGNIGRPALLAVVFGELFFVEDFHGSPPFRIQDLKSRIQKKRIYHRVHRVSQGIS